MLELAERRVAGTFNGTGPAGMTTMGELLGAAAEAFSRALQLTAATSAILVLVAAILAAVLLRDVPAGSGSEDPASPEPDAASQDSAGLGGVPGNPATETPENLVSEREGT
jgi:nitrate/nitrite transporter NarK